MCSVEPSTQAHCQAISAAATGPSAVQYTAACQPRAAGEAGFWSVSQRITMALANCGAGRRKEGRVSGFTLGTLYLIKGGNPQTQRHSE